MRFELPWPPSVNHYWLYSVRRSGRKSFVNVRIGDAGLEFRAKVIELIRPAGPALKNRLSVKFYAYPPDRRCRDLDNVLKALNDALTHAGVWIDDGQIDELTIIRKERIKGGKMIVEISEIEQKVYEI
jgi:crossover junction endodeoxyribonuclease RusA